MSTIKTAPICFRREGEGLMVGGRGEGKSINCRWRRGKLSVEHLLLACGQTNMRCGVRCMAETFRRLVRATINVVVAVGNQLRTTTERSGIWTRVLWHAQAVEDDNWIVATKR